MGKQWLRFVLSCALLTLVTSALAQGTVSNFQPVTDEVLLSPDDGDWIHSRRTYNGWGHSPLDQINRENVGELTLAWARVMQPGSNESTPIVYNGVMYLGQAGNTVQALDAATGDLIWEYRREIPQLDQTTIAALGDTMRSVAIYEDKIYFLSSDAYVVALDARTGQLVWEASVGDPRVVGQTAGPLIVNGKVISGRACDPALPGGCYITAHDSESGEELWRTFLIARPGEAGGDTWGDLPLESRFHVGAWGNVGAYDPELGLVFWGTSVPAPSPEVLRGTPGDPVLYSNSTLAIDVDTGEIVWYYQHLPRDNWDFDHPFERMIMDIEVAPNPDEVPWINPNVVPGQVYKTLTNIPGKTGVIYSLDRETGEFLWARPTVRQNVITEIRGDGTVVVNEDVIPDAIGEPYGLVCPTALGGRDWMAGAYNPDTNAIYQSLHNLCMEPEWQTDEWVPEDLYGISLDPFLAPGEENVGTLQAYSASTGELLWKYEQPAAFMPVLSTGGGLIFVGDVNRRFRAFDAATGEVLWETILGSVVSGHPVTYEVDGVQYVAVSAGGGIGIEGTYLAAAGLTAPSGGNMIYVFKLP